MTIVNPTSDTNRLTRAIADEEMRRKMNVEDEIEREFAEYQDTIEQKDKENAELKRQLEEYKKMLNLQNKQ